MELTKLTKCIVGKNGFPIYLYWMEKLAVSMWNFLEGFNNYAFTDNDDGICKDQCKERVRDDIVDVIYNGPNNHLFRIIDKDYVKATVLTLGEGWYILNIGLFLFLRKI